MRTPLLIGTCPICGGQQMALCGKCGICPDDALHDSCDRDEESVHGRPDDGAQS